MSRAARGAAAIVAAYQRLVSPFLPPACRFAPTCAEYTRVAFLEHGMARGAWLAARRLTRCHPFHPGGYDPPPLRPRGA